MYCGGYIFIYLFFQIIIFIYMGAASSSNIKSDKYPNLLKILSGIQGGPHCFTGGGDNDDIIEYLRDYSGGVSDKSKVELIRLFYKLASEYLDFKLPKTDDIHEMVENLIKSIPTTKKFRTVQKGEKSLSKFVNKMGEGINKEFGTTIVNMDQTEMGAFADIMRMIKSIAVGVGTDYSGVSQAVKEISENINVLSEIINQQMKGIIKKCDIKDEPQVDMIEKGMEIVDKKLKIQAQALRNIFNITEKHKSLEQLLKQTPNMFQDIMGQIQEEMPFKTMDKGVALLYALTGMVDTAIMAREVKNALDEMGVSAKEYEKLNYRDFKDLIKEKFVEKLKKGISDEDLKDFMTAVKLVKDFYGNRHEILKKSQVFGKGEISKEIKEQKELRKDILRLFVSSLNDLMQDAINVVDRLTTDLRSGDIPLTKEFRELSEKILILDNIGESDVMMYLSGFIDNVNARSKREIFLSKLKAICDLLDSMADQVQVLKDLSSLFKNLRSLIIDVSSKLTEQIKFGRIRGKEDEKQPDDALEEIETIFMGSGDESTNPQIRRLYIEFENLKYNILFFYRSSLIKHNLKNLSEQIDSYGSDYEDIRAKFVAKYYKDNNKLIMKMYEDMRVTSTSDNWEWVSRQEKNRLMLLKVAESIDQCLKTFTAGIAKHPEDLKPLIQMLARTEVLESWYSDDIGEKIGLFMELFPGNIWQDPAAGGIQDYAQENYGKEKTDGQSYTIHIINKYRLNEQGGIFSLADLPNGLPGNPFLTAKLSLSKEVFKQMKDILSNFVALKNIISMFSTIGDKYGDLTVSTSYISLKHVYDVLCEYMTYGCVVIDSNGQTAWDMDTDKDLAKNISSNTVNDTLADKRGVRLRSICDGGRVGKIQDIITSAAKGQTIDDSSVFANFDILFIDIIKAIVAKIFTTVDIYNTLNRPNTISAYMYKPASRIAIGADEFAPVPDVLPETVEMCRVVWLLEYYKVQFWGDIIASSPTWDLFILPDNSTPIFRELIYYIFVKCETSTKTGSYTDYEINKIVQELNKIYYYYQKTYQDPLAKVIADLVDLMNSIYSAYLKSEVSTYRNELKNLRSDVPGMGIQDQNVALRPLDDDTYEMLAPSFKYISADFPKKDVRDWRSSYHQMKKTISTIVENFTNDVNKAIHQQTGDSEKDKIGKVMSSGLVYMINAAKNEVMSSKTPNDKIRIMTKLIRAFSNLVDDSQFDTFIAFHEMVITGITSLYGIYLDSKAFYEKISQIHDVIVRANEIGESGADFATFIGTKIENQFKTHDTLFPRVSDVYLKYRTYGTNHLPPKHMGEISGFTYAGNPNANPSIKKAGNVVRGSPQTILRTSIDVYAILADLINSIIEYSGSSDDMVVLNIEGGFPKDAHFVFNFTKLRDYTTKLLVLLKKNIEKFRTHKGFKSIVRFYESDTAAGETIYGLEEKFEELYSRQLSSVSTMCDVVLEFLNRPWIEKYANHYKFVNHAGEIVRDEIPEQNIQKTSNNYFALTVSYYWYMLSLLTISPISDMQNNLPGIAVPTENIQPPYTVLVDKTTKKIKNDPAYTIGSPEKLAICKIAYNSAFNANNKSVFLIFNQLVAMYIKTVYDASVNKVYAPAIRNIYKYTSSMTEGGIPPAENDQVNNADARVGGPPFVDPIVAQYVRKFAQDAYSERLHQYKPEGAPEIVVLMQSNVWLVSQIVLTMDKREVNPMYLTSDFSIFPSSYKILLEKNLSILMDDFNNLIQRARLLVMFAENVNMVQLFSTAAGRILPRTHAENLQYYREFARAIITGCNVFISSINSVLEDIRTTDQYMSIAPEFENRRDEICPISNLTTYMIQRNPENISKSTDRPIYRDGTFREMSSVLSSSNIISFPDAFAYSAADKFMYGTRMISYPFKPLYYESFGRMISSYNSKNIGPHSTISTDDINDYVSTIIPLINKIRNYHIRKKYTPNFRTNYGVDFWSYPFLVYTYNPGYYMIPNNLDMSRLTFQVQSSYYINPDGEWRIPESRMNDIVEITQSTELVAAKKQLISMMHGAKKQEQLVDRASLRIRNIIELNTIPIRLSALMREFPMVNIMNFANTFDAMVDEEVQEKRIIGGNGKFQSGTGDAIRILRFLLKNPYGIIQRNIFYTSLEKIARGDINILGFGRPKMFTLQVWNKSLFGHIIDKTKNLISTLSSEYATNLLKDASPEYLTKYFSAIVVRLCTNERQNVRPYTNPVLDFDLDRNMLDDTLREFISQGYLLTISVLKKLQVGAFTPAVDSINGKSWVDTYIPLDRIAPPGPPQGLLRSTFYPFGRYNPVRNDVYLDESYRKILLTTVLVMLMPVFRRLSDVPLDRLAREYNRLLPLYIYPAIEFMVRGGFDDLKTQLTVYRSNNFLIPIPNGEEFQNSTRNIPAYYHGYMLIPGRGALLKKLAGKGFFYDNPEDSLLSGLQLYSEVNNPNRTTGERLATGVIRGDKAQILVTAGPEHISIDDQHLQGPVGGEFDLANSTITQVNAFVGFVRNLEGFCRWNPPDDLKEAYKTFLTGLAEIWMFDGYMTPQDAAANRYPTGKFTNEQIVNIPGNPNNTNFWTSQKYWLPLAIQGKHNAVMYDSYFPALSKANVYNDIAAALPIQTPPLPIDTDSYSYSTSGNKFEKIPKTLVPYTLLSEVGRNRFNSIFIRNIFWITNLQRLIDYKFREDLSYLPGPIVTGIPAISEKITEEPLWYPD